MKYLIDKEKLEARIAELLAGDGSRQADNVEGIALCALRKCLVPYEEKKEGCSTCGSKNGDTAYGIPLGCPDCHKKDDRCTKCNGDGKLMNQWDKATCVHCNGTGKEPRKEQDTRTHAWEMKTYTQDEVRKMLEELKMRDNLAGNSKEVQEDRKHMNTKIDKKIAEL